MRHKDRAIRTAERATHITFVSLGFAMASWASCIPQVKHALELSPSRLGLVLLAVATGAVIALPMSGPVVARFGASGTVRASAVLAGAGLLVAAIGATVSVAPVVAGLVMLGLGTGTWDVGMNVHGVTVGGLLGRSLLPKFHAGYSVGTVAGAVGGAAMIALGVGVTAHLTAAGLLTLLAVPAATRHYIGPLPPAEADTIPPTPMGGSLGAWREPRTLLIGAVVLAFTLSEGSGNDWIGVAMIGAHHVSAATATLSYSCFLSAMTAARWWGPRLLDRHGPVRCTRGLTAVASVGIALFAVTPWTALAFPAAILWGLGTSLGFSIGMTAGADDPAMIAPRVSVISSVGYLGFLLGPSVVGFLGQALTAQRAVAVAIVLLLPAGMLAGVMGPRTR